MDWRRSNENLYNIKHQNRLGKTENEGSMQKIKKLAQAVTKYKRAHFNKLKEEQEKLPSDQRVPHKLDLNGFAVPLTQREIHIAEGRLVIDENGNEVEVQLKGDPKDNPRMMAIAKYKRKLER